MTALAVSSNSVNLGQGFPDYDGPQELLSIAQHQIASGNNQYPPGLGLPDLRAAIAEHQQRFWDLNYDPDTEVLVTMGATEALAGALLGILNEGDEVIVFEPLFDTYAAVIALAGATLRPVTLRPASSGRFEFDPTELSAAITPRTRMILLNSPHNPTGTVFNISELTLVASLAIEHDLIVVSDEVYEHLTFDDAKHIPIATLPSMRERTITISSGGKTFSATGWKIGWACAPADLVNATRMAKQLFTFAGGTPFQPAIATGLRLPTSYFSEVSRHLQERRNQLLDALSDIGWRATQSEGTYFTMVDISTTGFSGDGLEFCRAMPQRCGVVAIPAQVLYTPQNLSEGKRFIRMAFCKSETTMNEATSRLRSMA
jgi:N-succinyldiaminopimelate aminotransferase